MTGIENNLALNEEDFSGTLTLRLFVQSMAAMACRWGGAPIDHPRAIRLFEVWFPQCVFGYWDRLPHWPVRGFITARCSSSRA